MNEDEALLRTLEERFQGNVDRPKGVQWTALQKWLEKNPEKLRSLHAMEATGGEPDVVDLGHGLAFADCSPESPVGRRSLCYDRAALESRKTAKPDGSAVETAEAMGVELLTEDEYRQLQILGEFDLKTSSWLKTPEKIRKLGGAIFADRRYDTVFTFHNGAESYYASRGFRGLLRI